LRYRLPLYLVKGIHAFHCEHSSLQYPQQPVFIGFNSNPNKSSPHLTILLHTSRFSRCSLPLRFYCKNFVNIYFLLRARYRPRSCHPLWYERSCKYQYSNLYSNYCYNWVTEHLRTVGHRDKRIELRGPRKATFIPS